MRNHNYYVSYNNGNINTTSTYQEGKRVKSERVRYRDIPKEYRRPLLEIIRTYALYVFCILAAINAILFFATVL